MKQIVLALLLAIVLAVGTMVLFGPDSFRSAVMGRFADTSAVILEVEETSPVNAPSTTSAMVAMDVNEATSSAKTEVVSSGSPESSDAGSSAPVVPSTGMVKKAVLDPRSACYVLYPGGLDSIEKASLLPYLKVGATDATTDGRVTAFQSFLANEAQLMVPITGVLDQATYNSILKQHELFLKEPNIKFSSDADTERLDLPYAFACAFMLAFEAVGEEIKSNLPASTVTLAIPGSLVMREGSVATTKDGSYRISLEKAREVEEQNGTTYTELTLEVTYKNKTDTLVVYTYSGSLNLPDSGKVFGLLIDYSGGAGAGGDTVYYFQVTKD